MASICQRIVNRASSSAKYAIRKPSKSSQAAPSFSGYAKSSSAIPSTSPSFSSKLKSPLKQLGCLQSLLPLHSAVATARLTSCLNDGSRSCRALSQGTLCCTFPGLSGFVILIMELMERERFLSCHHEELGLSVPR
ncbi:protein NONRESPONDING TO OXYLIPINS 2, mitochondrial-like isoform X2 [Nicotiana tomentosiformis]|uniref:protein NONRESPONDING TO OXYLIPINS 2, mitochondrial-like isoform X2 n=1 Tax=Nicotiana tomentosiformis TaxID=4098 RepID=UPI00051B4ED9|nr:uncharacterized protein LOC104088794 isoform X3 [Nicotiana tomentosiformis]